MRAALLAAALALVGSAALADEQSFALIERGKTLVSAGDCAACHTKEGGQPFAGGRPVETPFGIIYSPNITPDRETGIGGWSEDDFYKAMHEGIARDGSRLYPAFPYPYFTKMPREDVDAVRAYLNTLSPVSARTPDNDLMWPLNHRIFMAGWNMMFFHEGTFESDPKKSAEWNRGAYLVEGPGHCGACHTPKNVLGADKTSEALKGGKLQGWFAPDLTNDQRAGLGTWSADDVGEYLKTGRNAKSGAGAMMAEVVQHSTSKLSDSDIHAIAVYLKDVQGKQESEPSKPSDKILAAGQAIYRDSCAACHRADGQGVPEMFPPLAKNANVQSRDPTSVIRVILEGARTYATDERPTPSTMPAYEWKLSDDEVAAVATYVRNAWGNAAPAVSAGDVSSLKKDLSTAQN